MSWSARIFLVLVAAATLSPRPAPAWVAVRVVRPVGAVAVGVAAGAVAGAAVASAAQPQTVVVQPPPAGAPPPVGGYVTTLPPGCTESGGRYLCGSVWYQPYFGGNGVYYQAIPPPH
jgi:hypothetical protein